MTSTTSQPPATPPLSRVAMYILLAIGPEERHGYAIMHEVGRITGGAVKLGPGAIDRAGPAADRPAGDAPDLVHDRVAMPLLRPDREEDVHRDTGQWRCRGRLARGRGHIRTISISDTLSRD